MLTPNLQIAIPYSAILDVEKSSAMDFSETIEVKVFDKEPHFVMDSYFFAYFHELSTALDQIRDAVRAHRTTVDEGGHKHTHGVLDTTALRPSNSNGSIGIERAASMPNPDTAKTTSGFSRISSILKPFHYSISSSRSNSSIPEKSESSPEVMEEFTHISRRPDSSSFVPVTSSGSPSPKKGEDVQRPSLKHYGSSTTPTPTVQVAAPHTYPPSPGSEVPPLTQSDSSGITPSGSSWSVGVPSWLKGTRTKALTGSSEQTSQLGGVKELYSSPNDSATASRWSTTVDTAFSVLDTPEMALDADVMERFRSVFAFGEKETLLGCTSTFYLC